MNTRNKHANSWKCVDLSIERRPTETVSDACDPTSDRGKAIKALCHQSTLPPKHIATNQSTTKAPSKHIATKAQAVKAH